MMMGLHNHITDQTFTESLHAPLLYLLWIYSLTLITKLNSAPHFFSIIIIIIFFFFQLQIYPLLASQKVPKFMID
ncbi:hypothetical protein VNO77_17616 [Canavalia gladiata]|uniref:Uncharacterized protein n=1 Tax=Canavalia gladiata TaxID=3824 RepID=A0AAN9LP96_CANGL